MASTSESSSSSPAPSSDTHEQVRSQSLYDAVAKRSRADRFLNPSSVNQRTGKHHSTRHAPPETVLADRWRRQLKRSREDDATDDESEDIKLMKAELVVPSHRNEALPNSVFSHVTIVLNDRICWRRCINMSPTFTISRDWRMYVRNNLTRPPFWQWVSYILSNF
jgi:hypothetical protein